MPQIKLRLAPVLRTELDMLLTAPVLHPQFVQTGGADYIPRVVGFGDGVCVAGVVQGVGDIRPVSVISGPVPMVSVAGLLSNCDVLMFRSLLVNRTVY